MVRSVRLLRLNASERLAERRILQPPKPVIPANAGIHEFSDRVENAITKDKLLLKLKELARQPLPQPIVPIFMSFRGPEALRDRLQKVPLRAPHIATAEFTGSPGVATEVGNKAKQSQCDKLFVII